jgi:deoxyribodipyrimidine photo-lyase
MSSTAIWWIRRDLRLADNPALLAAARHQHLIALYIHTTGDDAEQDEAHAAPGAAARWWLHHSLHALDSALRALGSRLVLVQGCAEETLLRVSQASGANAVYWNRQYAPAHIARDTVVKQRLRAQNIHVESFNANLLNEPWAIKPQVKKASAKKAHADTPPVYKVFTPYWKACLQHGIDHPPSPAPRQLPPPPHKLNLAHLSLNALQLLPRIAWDGGLRAAWMPGEEPAWRQLLHFIHHHLHNYAEGRNLPAQSGSSRLSPHLSFGEISPRQIVHAVRDYQASYSTANDEAVRVFLSELGWREFGYHLLYHLPDSTHQPMNPRWQTLHWPEVNPEHWQAWTHGKTGIPLVDAGMRELWHTGWMHNRVRMNAASLLVKNMLIPWQHGERWFGDTLVDFDLASNVQGWQWTAGCGADAAPYFRVFNPALQGERFDPQGEYIRRWIPELTALPDRWIHRPWEAPAPALRAAEVRLGLDYPQPVVDLAASRARALAFFAQLKQSSAAP